MTENMLSWPAGPRKEDGIWAKYWYANVHKTHEFSRKVTAPVSLTGYLQELYEEALSYYEKLYTLAIKADVAQ